MAQANYGDTVKVHYTGTLVDGTIFDSSVDQEPLEFKIGDGRLIQGFEQAVAGMTPGETRSFTIPPDAAYGPHDADLVRVVDKKDLPVDLELEAGRQLQSVQSDGRKITVTISEVSESSVTLDANHPLAGQNLVFDIKLLEIV